MLLLFSRRFIRGSRRLAGKACVHALLPLAAGCGPDARPSDCAGAPDFFLQVTGEEGTLPADTQVRVYYGGSGVDAYRLDELTRPRVLFCTAVAAEAPGPGETGGGGSGGAVATEAGVAGMASTGGTSETGPSGVARIECELWSEGPACLEVASGEARFVAEELVLAPDACTVSESVELPLDEGSEPPRPCRDD